ncbi:tRNA-guanine(15) transglycosylase-like protein [Apodospora peruviana]|uniref:Queuine tRNA-ribosyltransferase accessory subunit 2 n=1 Tax=Apodospora peruviana TaxID=516989 RepID=A0AAE0MBM1_9PEZI|nr:tRNA-guanine(15) transglycosylase-like protein [Apodospora peruviana]
MSDESNAPAVMTFEVLKAAVRDGAAARLGRLALAGRKTVIDTPNYFANTSRGTVPHVTPDNISKHLQTGGAYMALEDFIEKPQQYSTRRPPIYDTPTPVPPAKALHNFTAMPPSVITILGARRLPAVPSPMGNSNKSVSVFTSTGFQVLATDEYQAAVQALKPDIAVPLADLTNHTMTPTSKRALRMAERTDDWIKAWFAEQDAVNAEANPTTRVSTFAPVLPINYSIQWEYLERLAEDHFHSLSGLAVYDPDVLPDIASGYPDLLKLPQLSLAAPVTPHHVLRQITLGIDVFVLPFINAVSDSGVALTFSFPPPPSQSTTNPNNEKTGTPGILPLGIDMSSTAHQTDLSPLVDSCTCYTCTSHHRAFIQHLLSAREMLGWTLLQIHNHAVMANFFAGIRQSLSSSSTTTDEEDNEFTKACAAFHTLYEPELPAGMGERPRARGYHFKSEGGKEKSGEKGGKRNKPAWTKFDDEKVTATGQQSSQPPN